MTSALVRAKVWDVTPTHIKTDYGHSHCTTSSHSNQIHYKFLLPLVDPIGDVAFKVQHSDKTNLDNVSEHCGATESSCKLDMVSPVQTLEP